MRISDSDYEAYEFLDQNKEEDNEEEEDSENKDDCDGCKYWSEMCAASIGCEPIKALCLNVNSPKYNRMVNDCCMFYVRGRSIDDPSR